MTMMLQGVGFMAKAFSLSSCCLSFNDETVLKSLLTLLETRTHAQWQYLESGNETDAVIVDIDAPTGMNEYQRHIDQGRIVIAYTAEPNRPQLKAEILARPMRARDLIEVLNRCDPQQSAKPAKSTAPEKKATIPSNRPATAAAPTSASNEATLFHWFVDTSSPLHDGLLSIEFAGKQLTVDLVQRCYCAEEGLSAYQDLFSAPVSELSVNVVTALPDLPPQALEALIWAAAKTPEEPVLHPMLGANNQFKLRRWPNFKQLGKPARADMKLAAYLTRHAADVSTIEGATGLSATDVIAFVNASFALGLVIQAKVTTEAPALTPQQDPAKNEHGGLWSKLRTRLGIA